MTTITEQLDRLAEMQAQLDNIKAHYESLRKSIIPAEIQAQLDEIDAEQATSLETAQQGIDTLTEAIKQAVIAEGATVKGAYLQAVYTKGRETWDGKSLTGYAAAHPEVLAFRKIGEPSVSLRGVK